MTDSTFEFGPFRLDTAKQVLWREGELVPLTPKALALLRALVESRGDVVPKRDLMARVWPDTVVEESNLSVTVAALRKELGAQESGASWVETVPRRGYRFAGPLSAPSARPVLALAVLPFRSIAAEPEPHLGLGMADALIARLTGVENLRVRPTGAVAQYAALPVAPLVAAEELGVDAVLDGTLQRQGDRLRLGVQLVPRSPGLPHWAAQVEGARQDVFAVQDELAEKVVSALSSRLGRWRGAPAWATRRTGADAWETWLRGCYFLIRLDGDGVAKAVGCFGEAAAADPAWAPPYAGLAGAYVLFAFGGLMAPRQALRLADQCAEEAYRRDPDLPEGHLARAWVALYHDWAWQEARHTLERAVAGGPPELRHWQALLFALCGQTERAAAALTLAHAVDPLSAAALGLAAFLHDISGRYAQALALARRAIELRPGHALGHWRLGLTFARLGRHDEAERALRKAVERSAGGTAMRCDLAWARAVAGRGDEARALMAEIEEATATMYLSPYQRAKVLAALGDLEAAMAALERSAEDRDPWIVLLRVDPALAALRDDARFQRLAARVMGRDS